MANTSAVFQLWGMLRSNAHTTRNARTENDLKYTVQYNTCLVVPTFSQIMYCAEMERSVPK
jgi:hypothetical protein